MNFSLLYLNYLYLSMIGGLVGLVFSFFIWMELSAPFCLVLESFYYLSVTNHGFLMLLFLVTPLGLSFFMFFLSEYLITTFFFLKNSNYINFYLMWGSLFFFFISLFLGEGVGAGWTLYPPLSYFSFSFSYSLDFLIVSIFLFGVNSLITSFNNNYLMLKVFVSNESIFENSPFIISYFFMGGLVLLSIPFFIMVLVMLFLDSNLNTFFFNYEFGGDSLLFQTIFWVFGHPEVYILILPIFGMISFVIEDFCFGGMFNKIGIIFSLFCLFLLSFIVFGHHMVTVGYSLDFSGFFMTSTIIMSIPTGIKIFSWFLNIFMCGGRFENKKGCLLIFLFLFSFGGVSGVFLSNVSLDLMFHDTYFVVGHFHIILGAASTFGFYSGFFFMLESFFFLIFNLYWLKVIFLFFSFLVITFLFLPFHFLGGMGFPWSVLFYSLEYFMFFYLSSFFFMGVILLVFKVMFMFFYFLF